MQINEVVGLINDLSGDLVRDALTQRPLRIPWEHAIEIFSIYRAVINCAA